MIRHLLILITLICPGLLAAATDSRSVQEIMAALDKYPVNEVRRDEAQKILDTPLPQTADKAELAAARQQRAHAAQNLGLAQVRIDELRALTELGGGTNPARAWRELSSAEYSAGNVRQAIEARQQAIALTPAKRPGQLPGNYAALAKMYRQLGEFDKARQTVREAEAILQRLRKSPNWEERHLGWEANLEDAIGHIEFTAGHYAEAEARFRKAILLKEQDNERILAKSGAGDETPTQEQLESRLDSMVSWLALTLASRGQLAEAETHARRAVLSAIGRGGQDAIQVARMLHTLAGIMNAQGRFSEALALVDRAAVVFPRTGVALDSQLYAQNHRIRAGSLSGLGRWSEALAEFETSARVVANDSQLANKYGRPSIGWIRALAQLKRPEEALAKARQLREQLLKRLGPSAYEAAEAQAYAGAILVSLQRDKEGIPELRQGLAVMIPVLAQESDRSGLRFTRLKFIVGRYLTALARIRGTALESALGLDAAGEAFVVADMLRGQAVQQAMLASSARAAAGSPELAELVRQEQDSHQERNALFAVLADLLSRPADQVLPLTIEKMRQRIAELERIEKSALQSIRERFPAYADLITPLPPSIKSTQAALRLGESLLSILSTEEQTFIWAIQASGKSSFAAVELGRQEIEKSVATLRAALDPGSATRLENLPRFDPLTAHRLYNQLLVPVAPGWQGAQHLLVATGGALASLPFAVLLTEAVSDEPTPNRLPYAAYRHWPWLINQMAISQLPSASSLLTLRHMPAGASSRSNFIGFGDPDFRGDGKPAKTSATRRFRQAPLGGLAQASQVDYSSIAALPDTREEILALAKTLNANPANDVFLGRNASRERVLQTDLSQKRIVAFATHGLVAGEYPGVDQPALALANPGGNQHGLLTLDDILTLKLDADWVVLSACNTAAGDGRGGEAISGLGRGFFYSGSRSLLVTHWPVETVSAQKLVVGVFNELRNAPGLNRAEALRRSMIEVMGSEGKEGKMNFAYAHPMFWAPYTLIGDGGK